MFLYDCFMYFDEDVILDLRFHTLDEYVDTFVIAEATRDHAGREKKLNFDIKNFPKFKDKVKYLVIDDLPINVKSDFMSINRYSKKIEIIKNELKEGNTYQINFTTDRIFKPLNNPLQTYLSVSRAACPKFGYYINTGSYSVLSFSPERFIKVKNSIIESWPMKGTRGRSCRRCSKTCKSSRYFKIWRCFSINGG